MIRRVNNAKSVDEAIGIEVQRAVCEAGSESAYSTLRTLCQTARGNNLRLIILIDDFEFLAHRFHLEYNFFSALRALYTNYNIPYLMPIGSTAVRH